MEWIYNGYKLTDDVNRVDVKTVHRLLSDTYWAGSRTIKQVRDSLKFSLCFSVFKDKKQVGFGRVVTDHVLFAWIADIIIAPAHRGKGLGKFMMSVITEHHRMPQHLQLLRTRDAHTLYEKFGFVVDECMIRRRDSNF